MHHTDFLSLQIKDETEANGNQEILCSRCHERIGIVDDKADGWRLNKWSLSVQLSPTLGWESYPIEPFISAQLLALIESQGARKFVVHSGDSDDAPPPILLWVFTPSIRYTSSSLPNPAETVKHALKAFYQHPTTSAQKMLDANPTSLEELYLPGPILQHLDSVLSNSSNMLPASARKFQTWDVGLLERFDLLSANESMMDVTKDFAPEEDQAQKIEDLAPEFDVSQLTQ